MVETDVPWAGAVVQLGFECTSYSAKICTSASLLTVLNRFTRILFGGLELCRSLNF
jgi:hypothetical protein